MFFWKKHKDSNDKVEAETTNEEKEEAKNYEDEDFGLAFIIPAGIKLYNIENPGPLKSRLSAESPIILVNPQFKEESINIKISDNVSEKDVLEYKNMLDKDPNVPLPKYKRVSVGLCKVGAKGDKPAVEHIFYMKGNIYGKLRQITFQHNGRGFTCTCGTAEERFAAANQQFFEMIFSSMEFRQIIDLGLLNMVPLTQWNVAPAQAAEERLVQELQSATDRKLFLGPHPAPDKKEGQCLIGGDFLETADSIPPALAGLSEQVKDKKFVINEANRLLGGGDTFSPVEQISEIDGQPKYLALKSASEATVVVDRIRFDFLYSRHQSNRVLMLFPQRRIGFLSDSGDDAVLCPVKK
jgi:hypothetical protein